VISLEVASQLAAVISAMTDVYSLGKQSFAGYLAGREKASDFQERGELLRKALSTYDDSEIKVIEKRIKGCRDRFKKEGGGRARKLCLCSVLKDVKDGNGGKFPFPEWESIYNQLGC